MNAPSRFELVYSLKCFAAAMLALYIAMRIGLPRPFWALMTTYIVANPMTGTVRSKALYRCLGTLTGSAVTVMIVPQLANAPELLSLALALWVGLCLYISLLDRTPRSYVFMLAGYTAALIGFPVVADPTTVFDVALARSEEITLGIVVATLVHSLVLPQSLGPALVARVNRTVDDARGWIVAVTGFAGKAATAVAQSGAAAEPAVVVRAWRKLAADITELRLMGSHLPFDTSNLRWMSGSLHALHDRLALMVPLLFGIEDRLRELGRVDPAWLTVRWRETLAEIERWIAQTGLPATGDDRKTRNADAGAGNPAAGAARLRAMIDALVPPAGPRAGWSELLQLNLALRLRGLVTAAEESFQLRNELGAVLERRPANRSLRLRGTSNWGLHRDHGMALRSAFAAVIATTACCAFWILTGWPSGSAAPMLAAVFCCFFATMDDPSIGIQQFQTYTIYSIPLSAFYLLVIFPSVHSFEMFAMTMAPLFLVLGILLPRPAMTGRALALIFGICGTLALQDTGLNDMVSFTNGMLAQLIGVFAAVLFTRVLRSTTPQASAYRVIRAGRRELVSIGAAGKPPNLLAVGALMLDRIALLAPRLASSGPSADPATFAALTELRIGMNMTKLRQLETPLARLKIGLRPMMEQLRAHFRSAPQDPGASDAGLAKTDTDAGTGNGNRNGKSGAAQPGTAALLAEIDENLRKLCHAPGDHSAGDHDRRQALAALTGMRRDLFPLADAYVPARPPAGPAASPSADAIAGADNLPREVRP